MTTTSRQTESGANTARGRIAARYDARRILTRRTYSSHRRKARLANGSDAEASTQLRNTLGSNNGVYIMFAKSKFYDTTNGTVAKTSDDVEKPNSVKFNECMPTS